MRQTGSNPGWREIQVTSSPLTFFLFSTAANSQQQMHSSAIGIGTHIPQLHLHELCTEAYYWLSLFTDSDVVRDESDEKQYEEDKCSSSESDGN